MWFDSSAAVCGEERCVLRGVAYEEAHFCEFEKILMFWPALPARCAKIFHDMAQG